MNNKKTYIFVILSIISFITVYPKAIIWDFENTLVKVDRLKMATNIGITDFLKYAIFDFKNPIHVIDEVFHLLSHINCSKPHHELPITADQKPLPYIFSHWLDGTSEYHQIQEMVSHLVKSFSAHNYFDSDRHQRLIQSTMQNMFDPVALSTSIIPIRSALSILKLCALKKKDTGEPEHQNYLLSNLASDTFDHYIKTSSAPRVFGYIKPENIFLSADYGMIKPNEDIFLYFLKKYNLHPKDCIFIDDQICNVNAAKKVGIHAIWVNNANYKEIRNELESLQII